MIISREFKPKSGECLYHYCSPGGFDAICQSRNLRFSDVFSMNDNLEMHWGYRQWELAAEALLNSVGKEFLDKIDEIVSASSLGVLPLISCFSTDSDVLSQWRAYAKDGAGFCIGFAQSALCRMAVRPVRVLYDEEKQRAEITQCIKALHKVHEEENDEEQFFSFCVMFAADLAAMKNPAFSEEKEVRLIHLVNFEPNKNSFSLKPAGGTAFGKPLDPPKISFQMRGSVPCPYVDMTYCEPDNGHCVKEVILGPSNKARSTAIMVYLETLGLCGVEVKKSSASYRSSP